MIIDNIINHLETKLKAKFVDVRDRKPKKEKNSMLFWISSSKRMSPKEYGLRNLLI